MRLKTNISGFRNTLNQVSYRKHYRTTIMAEPETTVAETSKENFVKDGKVYILGPFDRSISQNIIPGMADIIGNVVSEKNAAMVLYINSYGGYLAELFSVLAMIELAKSFGITIITHNLGVAYSCGSILAIHGDHRLMYRHATNLMHLGQHGFTSETYEQLDRNTKHAKKMLDTIVKMYVEHTKMTEAQVKKFMADDNCYLDAKECKKLGLCDEIL